VQGHRGPFGMIGLLHTTHTWRFLMSLSDPIIPVLAPFRPLFDPRTWPKARLLVRGTLLVRGRRTVAAALRVMGQAADPHFTRFHQVLNRATWSALAVSQVLLLLVVRAFLAPDAPLEIVIDEHLERRWGPRIWGRGHYRDPLLSSKGRSVSTSGLRWICCMVLVPLPWSTSCWALPFLTILTTPPAADAAASRRHKTITIWAQQVAILVRRWQPTRPIRLLGDATYSSLDLGNTCVQQQVRLLVPLRLDANLFAPPAPRRAGQVGAPRVKGAALPKLAALLTDPATVWTRDQVPWYAQGEYDLEWCSGQALWYHGGKAPVPIRWVLTRDPAGTHPPRAFLQTELSRAAIPLAPPLPVRVVAPVAAASEGSAAVPATGEREAPAGREVLIRYQGRWRLEVTLEESRAHLGVETQRQWSRRAIARSTPALLGLFSLVVLLGHARHPDGAIPIRQAAWYPKPQATFSDVLATVREQLWGRELLDRPLAGAEQITITRADLARVMQAAAA